VESSDRIITLLEILSEPAQRESSGFALPERVYERQQQKKQEALRELAGLQNNPTVRQMLSRITREVSSNGSIIVSELSGILRDQVLQRVGEYAAILLPEFRRAEAEEAGVTNYKKFIREAANYDPFLEGSNLTRDAYAGRGEVERDSWADGVNLKRRR
jgi:hypothetical protein